MHIERQMCRVNGDIVLHERANSLISMSNEWLRTPPKHSMVNKDQPRSGLNGALDSGAREIHRCYDSLDVALVGQLHAVQRARIIRNFLDVQQLVDEGSDLG